MIGASVSEISFTWVGFAAAMGSNLSLCFRNVLSKRFMTPEIKDLLGGAIGLFSMITILSFFMLAPIAVAVEGMQLTPTALRAAGIDPEAILKLLLSSALCFHLYQQVSYMILSRVSPVSHSIGNCLKVRALCVLRVLCVLCLGTVLIRPGPGLAVPCLDVERVYYMHGPHACARRC